MLKVFTQAPIAPQPAKGPFHHPAARNDDKACGARWAPRDFQLPPAVLFDPGSDSLIPTIGPQQLQPTPAVVHTALNAREEFRQHHLAPRAVREAGLMDHHQQEQPQHIDHDMAFAAIDLLVDIGAPLLASLRRLHALTVNTGSTGLRIAPGLLPHHRDQGGIELLPDSAVAPLPIIPIDRLPGGEVMGQQPPALSSTHGIEDGINDLALRPASGAAPGTGRPDKAGRNALPLGIRHIGGVGTTRVIFHPLTVPHLFSKHSLRTPPPLSNVVYRYILEFLATTPAVEAILDFRLTSAMQERAAELLEKNRADQLTPAEATELDEYVYINDLVSLLKARALTSIHARS